MKQHQFKTVTANKDKPSATDWNAMTTMLSQLARTAGFDIIIDSTGIQLRPKPGVHIVETVRVKNTTSTPAVKFSAFTFVKVGEFYPDDNYYDAELPDSEELGLTPLSVSQLAVINEDIEPDAIGLGYKGGVQKVEIYSDAENITAGVPCGSKDGSGKLMHGGPFRAVAVVTIDDIDYAWIRRDD